MQYQVILVIISAYSASCQLNIKLVNNGYENVLVAISDTVQYDPQIIPRIQELLNKSSATLFAATSYRAYFRKVTILVPTSWNVSNAQPATMESFDKAHIRIDQPSSNYGNNPWVRQAGGCGVPGEFMHVTPKFLLDKSTSIRKWGPLEKVIVHEWGHLRWGLFDEYPIGDQVTEHFYQSPTTNTIEPSRCNINVKGRMRHRVTGANCKIDPKTSLPESDCRYYPDRAATSAESSFMYYHYLPSVESFCDDNQFNYESIHNIEAPSRHNRLCQSRSSWSVMNDSPDFKNGNNQPTDSATQNTSVTFKIVQRQESKVVVVMDISGSMETNDNFIKLNSAVRRYLLYTVPMGASVGLVKYSSRATIITPNLVKVNSTSTRQMLASMVPLEKGGNTAIGQGLRAALQVLGQNSTGSRIILLTDGGENVTPFVKKVKPEVQAAGVVVDTILLTVNASQALISLAAQTGGLSFYSSGDSQSTGLNDAFTTSERARISNPRDVPVTVRSRVIAVPANDSICYTTMVDKALGQDTTVTFSWVHTSNLSIEITNSDGTYNATLEATLQAAAYKCSGVCATGSWKICMSNPTDTEENVVCQLESTAQRIDSSNSTDESLQPITVHSTIVNQYPNFSAADYKPVSLYATVTRGYAPVIGATVKANIEYPTINTTSTQLLMRDDGAGADIDKEDGIYSAFIINSQMKGQHSISIEVISNDNTNIKVVKVVGSPAGAISEPGDEISTKEVELTPAEQFQRFSLAGFINVTHIAPAGQDRLPPSRIFDLIVAETSYDNQTVTLEWTAVGDDLDEGKAASYELWKADTYQIMYKEREQNATKVSQEKIKEGNLNAPQTAYSRERLIVDMPDKTSTSVYALIVRDDADNPSQLSNVVSVKLMQATKQAETKNLNVGGVVGGVVGGLSGLLVVIIVVVTMQRRKKSSTIV
ncbi:calcium-activated chloride channel regulator 3A-1-like isoform X2 [Watersipora subatra]|uniref:calcium-activated chloride channel regulator 3A-1-like isoform X2 n=1 Tax=Watersipora subatra TaxID=2589382 RepID=UPI00355B1CE7